jgi:hypothetical protein
VNCRICAAPLLPGAMFCGECGSSTTATARTRKRPDPRPSDTTIIQRLLSGPQIISVPVPVPVESGGLVAPAPVAAASEAAAESVPRHTDEKPSVPGPRHAGPVATESAVAPQSADKPVPARFVFQFSTGETVSVQGSGLIGRRPLPQPSEFFDQLIQINDVGMSVSKSHLEFGQYDGELWVSDRFSGNGTIIRRPSEAPLRCEPGRRYLVPRQSRVEIAEQFFVVS